MTYHNYTETEESWIITLPDWGERKGSDFYGAKLPMLVSHICVVPKKYFEAPNVSRLIGYILFSEVSSNPEVFTSLNSQTDVFVLLLFSVFTS